MFSGGIKVTGRSYYFQAEVNFGAQQVSHLGEGEQGGGLPFTPKTWKIFLFRWIFPSSFDPSPLSFISPLVPSVIADRILGKSYL